MTAYGTGWDEWDVPIELICPCPALPVVRWHHPVSGWDDGHPMAEGGQLAEVARHRAEYEAAGCDGWLIMCPTCRQPYAAWWSPGEPS